MTIDSFRPRRRESGFTLIELMIVVAIMLVISAMAMPRVMNSIDDVRLRSSMRDLIGLMQQARQRAIKDNAFYQMGATGNTIYIDLDNGGALNNNEPVIQLPYTITLTNAGVPAWNPQAPGVGPNFVPTLNVPPAYNNRGLPCAIGGGNCVTRVGGPIAGQPGANVCFLFYFRQTRTFGAQGWAAITVTSAGRMKAWFYDATTGVWSPG